MIASEGEFDCSELTHRVFAFIDDELTVEDCARIKAHLAHCGSCLSEYESDLVLKQLVRRSCISAAPATLRISILTRITSITVTRSAS